MAARSTQNSLVVKLAGLSMARKTLGWLLVQSLLALRFCVPPGMHMDIRLQMGFQAEMTAKHAGTFAKTHTELRNKFITGLPLRDAQTSKPVLPLQ